MHGPHTISIQDIHGSPVLALLDELFVPSEDYVPKYTYQDYKMPHFKPTKRYDLNYGKVACWQDGGVWIKELSTVELQALTIDRFQESDRILDQAREDEFCSRLRLHGASFWVLPPKWPESLLWCSTIECVKPSKQASFEVGFPSSGGIWVLDTMKRDLKQSERLALKNALNMDERCSVLKTQGAVFCHDIKTCQELADLLAV